MKFRKEALWSVLEIETKLDLWEKTIEQINNIIEDFENKYSRFIEDNFLDKLNKSWFSHVDEEFKTIFNLCETLYKATNWYYDITISPVLEKFWYWTKNGNLEKEIWFDKIKLDWNSINLNWTSIEFWSIWKWYIIDKIYDILKDDYTDLIINFGWDIKIWENEKIVWLEDPFNDKKIIWDIKISNSAFWSSSWQKRKFWDSHHLINPKNKHSQNDKIAIYVTHKYASFADSFSTALFVTPLEKSLIILENIDWLEWLIISKKWEIYKSKWFDVNLF